MGLWPTVSSVLRNKKHGVRIYVFLLITCTRYIYSREFELNLVACTMYSNAGNEKTCFTLGYKSRFFLPPPPGTKLGGSRDLASRKAKPCSARWRNPWRPAIDILNKVRRRYVVRSPQLWPGYKSGEYAKGLGLIAHPRSFAHH